MYSETEYLQYAVASGMIDLATVQAQMEMAERQKYLEGHKIYADKNGKWYTRLEIDGKIKLVKRPTKEAIEKEIIEYEKNLADDPIVQEVFTKFINSKLRFKDISKATYDRYIRDYDRYFKGERIEKIKFKMLTEDDLELFIRETIADKNLTAKAYSNLKTIIRGMLIYAKGKYTNISASAFFSDLQFSKNTFERRIVSKEKEVFLEDEIPKVMSYLNDAGKITHMGILLAFQTGLRVGELATIEKADIILDNNSMFIHIQRTETKYKEGKEWVTGVKEYPKSSAGDRYVFCTEKAQETVERILKMNPDGKYLFEKDGKRIYESAFANTITWMCQKLNIPMRSMHKIRKTYGTTLIDGGVDEAIIVEQMGHSDIHCTKQYYYFSNKNRDKKREQLSNAINF